MHDSHSADGLCRGAQAPSRTYHPGEGPLRAHRLLQREAGGRLLAEFGVRRGRHQQALDQCFGGVLGVQEDNEEVSAALWAAAGDLLARRGLLEAGRRALRKIPRHGGADDSGEP